MSACPARPSPDSPSLATPWIAEVPVGDWFYGPGFTYDSGMVIRYILEAVAGDGNAAICVSLRPDGSLDEGSIRMLKEIGEWMRLNGAGIYGSHAWVKPGEGEIVDGKLKMLPGGKLTKKHADFQFSPEDFRFTVGNDGALYAYCFTVPKPGTKLKITSLSTTANLLGKPVKSVTLLGREGHALKWKQEPEALVIDCPAAMPFATAVGFKITTN